MYIASEMKTCAFREFSLRSVKCYNAAWKAKHSFALRNCLKFSHNATAGCNSHPKDNSRIRSTQFTMAMSIHAHRAIHQLNAYLPLPFCKTHLKKNIDTPAAACKKAKRILTVFTGSFPRSLAPNAPPTVTPIAVGISTEKSYKPRKK